MLWLSRFLGLLLLRLCHCRCGWLRRIACAGVGLALVLSTHAVFACIIAGFSQFLHATVNRACFILLGLLCWLLFMQLHLLAFFLSFRFRCCNGCLLLLLILLEFLEAIVLALDETFEMREGLAELLENVRGPVAVTRRCILRVDRIDDHKHLLTLRRLIERPRTTSNVQLLQNCNSSFSP